jgi:hypothetical protein
MIFKNIVTWCLLAQVANTAPIPTSELLFYLIVTPIWLIVFMFVSWREKRKAKKQCLDLMEERELEFLT